MEMLHISYTMCTCGSPDIYTLSPWSNSPWASSVYIKQTTSAHDITINYTHLYHYTGGTFGEISMQLYLLSFAHYL